MKAFEDENHRLADATTRRCDHKGSDKTRCAASAYGFWKVLGTGSRMDRTMALCFLHAWNRGLHNSPRAAVYEGGSR
jgi:hypothetical protein